VTEPAVEVHPLRCGDALAPPGWFFRGEAPNPLRALGIEVATGVFGARMAVELVNDGPVTIVL